MPKWCIYAKWNVTSDLCRRKKEKFLLKRFIFALIDISRSYMLVPWHKFILFYLFANNNISSSLNLLFLLPLFGILWNHGWKERRNKYNKKSFVLFSRDRERERNCYKECHNILSSIWNNRSFSSRLVRCFFFLIKVWDESYHVWWCNSILDNIIEYYSMLLYVIKIEMMWLKWFSYLLLLL